jgi:hypothetical protein
MATPEPSIAPSAPDRFIREFTGFDQPWRLLAGSVPDLQVTELGAGAGYRAVGHARDRSTPPGNKAEGSDGGQG